MHTITSVIEALERAPGIVVPLVREVPSILVKRRPTPTKWSVHEHACHLAQVDRLYLSRLDQILAQPQPVITPYDPGRDEADDIFLRMDLERSLAQYAEGREALVKRLRQLAPEIWSRTAEHGEYSHYSVLIMFRHVALHDLFHAYRIEELLLKKEWKPTGLLTADMKRVVEEQRLGFVATVCPDGTPNLSPKGTTAVWDDDHLVFANMRSPGTIANVRQNANVEVNVVDPLLRKGYRFKGVASVLESGALYEKAIAFYKERGSRVSAIREVVLVQVQRAQPIDSPAYDLGLTEAEVRSRWESYFQSLRAGKTAPPASE